MKEFISAPEVEDLVRESKLLKDELSGVKIKYLFNTKQNLSYMGKCSLASGKWKFLTGYNYIIEIGQIIWLRLTDEQKKALISHELEHVCFILDEKTGDKKWKIKKHSIEEFTEIVKQYGCWSTDLIEFKKALEGTS